MRPFRKGSGKAYGMKLSNSLRRRRLLSNDYQGCPNQNPNAENVPEHSINEEEVALMAPEAGQK
jgi:hypothetical protein